MPRIDPNCPICAEDDLRVIVDSQLWNGHDHREIARELGRNGEFSQIVWYHFKNLHVLPPTRDNFTMHLITYMQDIRKVERRELEKNTDRQRPSVLDRCDKARRWSIEQIAKFEGFYEHKQRRLPNEAQKLLEEVRRQNPEIEARIQAHQRAQEPVEVIAVEEDSNEHSGDSGETQDGLPPRPPRGRV